MPGIDYTNGRLQFDGRDSADAATWMHAQPWLEAHPTKGGVWYCYPFNTTVTQLREAIRPVWKYFTPTPKALGVLRSFPYIRKRSSPLPLKGLAGITLEHYQQESLNRMAQYHDFCIFLGPGTGKTLIALTFLNSLNTPGVHVVLTPKRVITQYAEEARKYLDDSWEICEGTLPCTNKALIVSNYEALSKLSHIKELQSLILDESHRAKSVSSLTNKKLCELAKRCANIYMFTGTPSQSHYDDIFGQLKILNEQLVGAKTYFMQYFFETDDYGRPQKDKRREVLDEVLSVVSYGGKTEDLLSLPQRHEHKLRCDAPDKLYGELKKTHVAFVEGQPVVCDSPAKLGVKLRQIPCGHLKLGDGTVARLFNPKERVFLSLIPTLKNGIIYTQFDADILLVTEMLDRLGRTYACVNGKIRNTGELVNQFKQQQVEFLVIQAQSGNAGLDLTVTNNIVFYSLPLSSIVYEQCLFRVWRRGQTLDCHYYYLLVPNTIESIILRNLKEKKQNTDRVLGMYKGEQHERFEENYFR